MLHTQLHIGLMKFKGSQCDFFEQVKYSKNIVRFVSLTHEHKFINLYFIGSCNTQLLDDIGDGGEYSISVSQVSTELNKVSASKRATLSAIPFNFRILMKFVVHDHDCHSEEEVEVHSDDSDSDDVVEPSGGK
ncbi:hypothetical protein LIER_42749 [Lithospermum erythrorhizon]|uniref:Uncharacterized protein n=1 Tax=Lithospermum erythrorhizon TaxID=34254 RepID=A0AAV3NUZ1_LITER